MKLSLLIVDDSSEKTDMIGRELCELGVASDDIMVVRTAAEAFSKLKDNYFDLLLLDLIIPARSGAREKSETGLELLRQIVDDKLLPSPKNIVGITSDNTALLNHEGEFRRMTTQILFIDPLSNDWKVSLRLLVGRIQSTKSASFDVDACFLTALREPEHQEVLNLPLDWSEEEYLEGGVSFSRGRTTIRGVERKFVAIHCAQPGPVQAAITTKTVIDVFRPRVLVMSGICGGIEGKISIGDVVIADKSWDWQCGKWVTGGTFEIAPDQKEASTALVALAQQAGEKLSQFYKSYEGARPNNQPTLFVGPMVSGSAVVADPAMHTGFITQHRKSLAVDMECYGFYCAARSSTLLTPKILCIKSVSDLANREKSDDYQSYCSYVSAKLALEVLNRHFST